MVASTSSSLNREAGLIEAGISTEINQENINRVLDAVRDDRREKVAVGGEIEGGKDRAGDDVFDNAGRTLWEMSEAKEQTDQNRRRKPGGCRSSENFGKAIEQITAPNRFFAECCENPREKDSEN